MDASGHRASSERERSRIDALRRYRILDTPPDGAFDRVTALVANLIDVPISIVSLVDADRIWFKSSHGLDAEQVGHDPGLCASAVLQDGPYVVEDAIVDPRAMTNPLVAGALGFRFYAGVPLRTRDGHNLGMLTAIDVEPRTLSPRELRILQDLAAIVMDEMELRLAARAVDDLNAALKGAHHELRRAHEELEVRASRDGLTGLTNRDTILDVLETLWARSSREGRPLAVMAADIDGFKEINDAVGHLAGDLVLRAVAERLSLAGRASDTVGRFGGDEFLVVMYPCDAPNALATAERICAAVSGEPIDLSGEGAEARTVGLSGGSSSAPRPRGRTRRRSSVTPTRPCTAPRPKAEVARWSSSPTRSAPRRSGPQRRALLHLGLARAQEGVRGRGDRCGQRDRRPDRERIRPKQGLRTQRARRQQCGEREVPYRGGDDERRPLSLAPASPTRQEPADEGDRL